MSEETFSSSNAKEPSTDKGNLLTRSGWNTVEIWFLGIVLIFWGWIRNPNIDQPNGLIVVGLFCFVIAAVSRQKHQMKLQIDRLEKESFSLREDLRMHKENVP